MTNINQMIGQVRYYEKHGIPVNDIDKIAEMALKESYNCSDSYHGTLMYLMAIELISQQDDLK